MRYGMNRQTMTRTIVGATALWLMAAASAPAEVVRSNLRVWLDAGDHNADGVQQLGAGTRWRNKAPTGSSHDATLTQSNDGPRPAWAGNGTVASPYAVQFHFIGSFRGGYAVVANSAGGTDMDTPVFTYEVWTRRSGVGASEPGENGTLIARGGAGVGGIHYAHKASAHMAARELFCQGGDPVVQSWFPKSAGTFATGGFQQIVFTRAGNGDAQSAFYLNGVLRGRFKTEGSKEHTDTWPLTIAGRLAASPSSADNFLECDVAVVRVYATALTDTEVRQNFVAEASRFGVVIGRTQ
jgi:hypothetical protein